MKTKKGFTLIELLIVIAIIGILAVALMPTILNAPGKARDSARVLNISALATAVEAYNADVGQYPTDAGCFNDDTDGPFAGLAGDYFSGGMSGMPSDPSPSRTTTSDAVGTCVDAESYYYTPIESAYGQYAISTIMELSSNNNTGGIPAATGDPFGTACDATDGCAYYTEVL